MLFPVGQAPDVSCQTLGFLRQRVLQDLSPTTFLRLCDVSVCILRDVRPAASFRFSAMMTYPCDVDHRGVRSCCQSRSSRMLLCRLGGVAEESWYRKFARSARSEQSIFWGGLKAGHHPTQKQLPSGPEPEVLEWSLAGLMRGEKSLRRSGAAAPRQPFPLQKALEEGNKSRTAFITVFAKGGLVQWMNRFHVSLLRNYQRDPIRPFVRNGQIMPM